MTMLGETEAAVDRFDVAIECLLISLLAFMPFAFGAVEAWSEEVVIALAAAISITFLIKLAVVGNARCIWSLSYVPVVLFILVVVFQLIHLPAGFVELIAPSTAAIKQELLGDLPEADEVLSSMTISFYPHATKHDLRLVLAVMAVFIVVLNVYRRGEKIKRLLAAIVIIGGAVALLALAQDIFGSSKIYWFVPTGVGKADSGPFINHSHFGQFMNLSIGAALGLIMVKLHESFTGSGILWLFAGEGYMGIGNNNSVGSYYGVYIAYPRRDSQYADCRCFYYISSKLPEIPQRPRLDYGPYGLVCVYLCIIYRF